MNGRTQTQQISASKSEARFSFSMEKKRQSNHFCNEREKCALAPSRALTSASESRDPAHSRNKNKTKATQINEVGESFNLDEE
jgi:hypothetical protein